MWLRAAFGLLFALIYKNKFLSLYKKQTTWARISTACAVANPFEYNRPKVVLR